jgi:hypothetical protein
MLAHAALALALDQALEPEDDFRAGGGLRFQRLSEVEVAGDLQRCHLPGFRRPGLLLLDECGYLLPKSVHAGESCLE